MVVLEEPLDFVGGCIGYQPDEPTPADQTLAPAASPSPVGGWTREAKIGAEEPVTSFRVIREARFQMISHDLPQRRSRRP